MRAYVESDNPRWNGISLEIPAPFLMGREPPPHLDLQVRAGVGGGAPEEVFVLHCRMLGHVGEAAFYRPEPDDEDDDETHAMPIIEVTVWTAPPGGPDRHQRGRGRVVSDPIDQE